MCRGKADTHIVVPRVVKPDGSQDEHRQGNEETTETHRVQVSKGGLGSRRGERNLPRDL